MGWALQRPRAGGTGCSSYVKVYLKARFDAGEESRCKADPEQFAIDTRNARKKDPGNPGGGSPRKIGLGCATRFPKPLSYL